jgi:hypothetical protein
VSMFTIQAYRQTWVGDFDKLPPDGRADK